MRTINFYGFEGLTMINGVLTPINAKEVVLREDYKVAYSTEDGILVDPVLYATKEDFEAGKPCDLKEIEVKMDGFLYKEEDGLIYTQTWKMQDGEPKEIYLPLQFIVKRWTKSKFLAKPIIPEDRGYYASREDCIRYGSYVLKGNDGTTHEEMGIGLKLQLSDTQKEFIEKEFIPILEKARELGIQFIFNGSTDKLSAVNVNNLTGKLGYDYDEEGTQYISSEKFYKVPHSIWGENEDSVWYDEE